MDGIGWYDFGHALFPCVSISLMNEIPRSLVRFFAFLGLIGIEIDKDKD